ncbi:MAG: hypothetical protein EU548_01820 [Promethearchaeota archaeon]|nr:MAG: hypothetical protein EU548_01820 [Candidatus Lokiarchaeota archaeon]
MKFKKKFTALLLISLFFFTTIGLVSKFATSIDSSLETSAIPSGVDYDWEEYLFDSWMNQTWDQATTEYNYNGTYSDTYTYTYDYYYYDYQAGQTLKRKITNIYSYETNSTSYSNYTITGEMSYHLVFDTYKVEVTYGDFLKLLWFGFRNGSIEMIQELSEYVAYSEYSSEQYYENTEIIKTYNDTDGDGIYETQIGDDIILETNDTHEYSGSYETDIFEYYGSNVDSIKMVQSLDVLYPLILSTQIYTTQNSKKVAWGEMIPPSFFIYNDTDNDGIYSAGESNSGPSGGLSLGFSDELVGTISPMAANNVNMTQSIIYSNGTEKNLQTFGASAAPQDVTPNELTENITFNPPQETANGLSWDINYEELPLQGGIYDSSDSFYLDNSKYDWASPTNFSFGFNYDIGENRSDLFQTFGISKITNSTFYDELQGLSLSIPHYNYFISSEEITQETENAATVPTDIINFTLSGIPAAQIDMGLSFPEKKNYTLYNYPSEGNITEIGALGSTVSQIIVSSEEQTNQQYSIVDMLKAFILPAIENDPAFNSYSGVLAMATQNYPVWSGEHLVHDPTFSVFYSSDTGASIGGGEISGFLYLPLFATVVITLVIITKRVNRKRKD